MPNTPFSTRLSGSAKEAELRLRNIFQWKKRRAPVVLVIAMALVVLLCCSLVSCNVQEEANRMVFNEEITGVTIKTTVNNRGEIPVPEECLDEIVEWLHAFEIGEKATDKETYKPGTGSTSVLVEYADGTSAEQDISLVTLDNKQYWIKSPDAPQCWLDLINGEYEVPVKSTDTNPILALEGLSEIGKTLASIWSENPGFEYRIVQIPGAAGLCLKQIQDGPLCYFVGTHDGPSLREVGGEYADQLRCAGIVSTVGRAFPATADGVSLEQFFAELVVSEYTYYTQDGSGQGWIEFSYGGYCVWIDTNGESAYSDHYVESSVMRHDYPLVVVDKEIEIANSAISSEYARVAAVVDAQHRGRLATVDGISHMPLDELPQEVLDSLTLVSETDLSGRYNPEWGWHRVYTAPGLEITTTAPSAAYLEWREEVDKNNRTMFPTEADFYAYVEGEEGREWLVNVTFTDDKYATLDGLRVGTTCAQAEALGYSLHEGQNQIGNVDVELSIIVENDTVVQMSTWWTMGRYIGKFFEL